MMAKSKILAGGFLPEIVTKPAQGLLVVVLVALAAQFLSEHYGSPAMLMALLLGIAVNFLAEEPRSRPGVQLASHGVLRVGVALLGARISVDMLRDLGPVVIGCVVLGVLATIAFGVLLARLLRRDADFGLLTGGSVAICGASAAMAIAAVLPQRKDSERDLTFTVLGVTVLSTLAMIAYPILASSFGFDDETSGVFLGGTIHDVAQVVGAGFSVSDETGEVAVLVKLIRVSMLAPVVLLLALRARRTPGEGGMTKDRPTIMPGFLIAFAVLVLANSLGLIPLVVQDALTQLSRWALLVAIAAVGIKTSPRAMLSVGGTAIIMVIAETVFLAVLILVGVTLLRG
jgi:uncharacterized integral membrane protein (TIGR00698 family)